jgi:hypothetical protein
MNNHFIGGNKNQLKIPNYIHEFIKISIPIKPDKKPKLIFKNPYRFEVGNNIGIKSDVFNLWNNSKNSNELLEAINYELKYNTNKEGHWIWYVYPNIEGISDYYEFELTNDQWQILKENKEYLKAIKLLENKKLKWFDGADRGRVKDFRKKLEEGKIVL